MTDEQIEKGLICCLADDACKYCPYYDKCDTHLILLRDINDYINRIKSENKKLKDTLNAIESDLINARGNLENCLDEKEQIRKDTAKELFKKILDSFKGVEYFDCLFEGLQAIGDDDFGVRIMKNSNDISVEVDDE